MFFISFALMWQSAQMYWNSFNSEKWPCEDIEQEIYFLKKTISSIVLCYMFYRFLWKEKIEYQVYNESHMLLQPSLVILLQKLINQLTWSMNPIWTLLHAFQTQSYTQSWSRDTNPQILNPLCATTMLRFCAKALKKEKWKKENPCG